MDNTESRKSGWQTFVNAVAGFVERITAVLEALFNWIFRLRKIFMALPVLYVAWRMAQENLAQLPETVGFDIQASGEFAQMLSRETAVYGPLGLTCICLVLMFLSRRTVYPWLISVFSLVLPVLIWALNVYLV